MNKTIDKIIKEIKTEFKKINKPIIYYKNLDILTLGNIRTNKELTIKPISNHYNDLIINLDRKVGIVKKILKKYDLEYKFIFFMQDGTDIIEYVDEYETNKYFPNDASTICNLLSIKISELMFETNSIFTIIGILSEKNNRRNLKHIVVD